MKWTAEQSQVLTSRGHNLLVAAAAGSGKTAVLVERIVRLVLDRDDPADLENILVVTFTQAAAQEMKERIRKAFALLAASGNIRARDQLARVSDAPISTIHAFCLNTLREHFHQAGLEPGFRVGEQTECALILNESLEQLMDDVYGQESMNPAFMDLLDCYAGYRDDSRLREQIVSLWRFSRTMPWPEAWLTGSVQQLRTEESDFGLTEWGRLLREEIRWRLADLKRETDRALRLADASGFDAYAASFAEDADSLEQLQTALDGSWDSLWRAVAGFSFKALKRAPKDADPDTKEQLQAMRKRVKDGVSRVSGELLRAPSATLIGEIRGEAGRLETLAGLALALDRRYARHKRRRNLVDFDDLEHLTLGLLLSGSGEEAEPTELAVSMRNRWHSVMIDEYQDSNLVQEAILAAISTQTAESGNLFMVGDVKQSIYRFRQAMPELFLTKYAAYPPEPSEGAPGHKILLHRNFRSRAPILEAVNLAFSRLMTPQLGEMAYTEEEALVPGASFEPVCGQAGLPVTLCLLAAERDAEPDLERDPVEGMQDESVSGQPPGEAEEMAGPDGEEMEEETDQELLESAQQEAIWAARTIWNLVKSPAPLFVTDREGGLRPARFRDCAILMRATSGSASVFVEEFALAGIPLFSDTGSSYLESVELGVVLSFLQLLDNPRQDIPLAAVLRSPLYEWGETMLAEVRQSAPDKDLLDAVSCHDGLYADACATFLQDLGTWRERARLMPVGDLLERLYDETGYALHVAGLPQGRRRLANLRLLVDRATRFESTGFRGLFQFIRYVDRLRLAKGDFDGAKIIGEGEDVVRLMSIHKSKGLEFPVVLVCGTGRQFNVRDKSRRMLMHHRYGLGPDAMMPDVGAAWETAAKRALQAVSLREMLSEEMRILYVALTRAKECLYVSARLRQPRRLLEQLRELPETGALPAGMLLPLRSHAHWLLAAWGPLFDQPESVVRLEIESLETLLSWRRETVLAGGEQSGQTPLSSDNEGWVGPSVGNGAPIGRHHDAASVPDGQLSLFDGSAQASLQTVVDRTIHEARRRLAWKAPHARLSSLPSKMTVTSVKRLWEEQDEVAARLEEAFRIACTAPEELLALSRDEASGSLMDEDADDAAVLPAFMRLSGEKDGETSGLRYGTLMHLVLQHLEPKPDSLPDVEKTIAHLVETGMLPVHQAHLPNRKALEAFIHSLLFLRMRQARSVHRETPFTIRMPASEILRDPSIPANETVILQGIVDNWFVEGDGIVLVDYKTDKTMARVPAYRHQLTWYAAALEKTTGMPVKERILWFLHHGMQV